MANYYSITVTPTVLADAADENDVIFNPTVIPGAVPTLGGAAKLIGVNAVYYDDYREGFIDLYFFEKGDNNLGTLGAAISISDANLKANKFLGYLPVNPTSVGDLIASTAVTHDANDMGIVLQAASGSSDIFVAGVYKNRTQHTFTADGIDLTFSFES